MVLLIGQASKRRAYERRTRGQASKRLSVARRSAEQSVTTASLYASSGRMLCFTTGRYSFFTPYPTFPPSPLLAIIIPSNSNTLNSSSLFFLHAYNLATTALPSSIPKHLFQVA